MSCLSLPLPSTKLCRYVDAFIAPVGQALPGLKQKLLPIHVQPSAAHSTHHSPGSHRQCRRCAHACHPHRHSANKCAPTVHIAAPGALSELSELLLQAGGLFGIGHREVELHESAHHKPAMLTTSHICLVVYAALVADTHWPADEYRQFPKSYVNQQYVIRKSRMHDTTQGGKLVKDEAGAHSLCRALLC